MINPIIFFVLGWANTPHDQSCLKTRREHRRVNKAFGNKNHSKLLALHLLLHKFKKKTYFLLFQTVCSHCCFSATYRLQSSGLDECKKMKTYHMAKDEKRSFSKNHSNSCNLAHKNFT